MLNLRKALKKMLYLGLLEPVEGLRGESETIGLDLWA